MTRCPDCGERVIGNPRGIGMHLSSVAIGLLSGLFTWVVLVVLLVAIDAAH